MQNNPLTPLQQSVFEQAPQATFVPPAQQTPVYQEGQVVFADPIYSIDPGIAWYQLGEQAAETANMLFGQTLDYLIDSKRNAVGELADKYQTELNNTYLKLTEEQKKAEALGLPPSKDTVDGLLKQIETTKANWRAEADEALETGKSVFFQPAINYWDDDLDIKGLGLKYQQLALSARGADRNISDQAQKLVFDAQLANLLKKQANDKVGQAKQGYTTFDSKDNAKVLMGALPFGTSVPVSETTGTKLFHVVDPVTGQEKVRTVGPEEIPLIVTDEGGTVRINPTLDYQSAIRATNEEEFKFLLAANQDLYPNSASYSVNGTLTPELEEYIKGVLDVDPNQRDPNDLWKIGYIFTRLPASAVRAFGKKNNLSETDIGLLAIDSQSVRSGFNAANMSKSKRPDVTAVTSAVSVLGTLSERSLGGIGIAPRGLNAQQTVDITNNVVVPLIGAMLNLSPDEQANYAIEIGNRGSDRNLILDTSPAQTISSLLATNPLLAPVAMKGLSYFISNPHLLYDEEGEIRDQDSIRKALDTFIQTEIGNAGLVVLKDKNTGTVSSTYNPSLLYYYPELSEDRQEAVKNYLDSPYAGFTVSEKGEAATQQHLRETVKKAASFAPKFNQDVFLALYNNLQTSVQQSDGTYLSGELPASEVLRLAVASSEVTWTQYGYRGETDEATKMQFALKAWEDINPASMWDIDVDTDNNAFLAFTQSEKGGLPISFGSITTKSGRDLLKGNSNIIPSVSMSGNRYIPQVSPGVPAFNIAAKEPSKFGGYTFEEHIQKAKQKKLAGLPTYTLLHTDDAPARTPLSFDAINNSVRTFAASREVAEAFVYSEYDPIIYSSSPRKAYDWLVVNLDAIKQIAQKSPELDQAVQSILKDLERPENKRVLLTETNVEKMFLRARDTLKIKSNADFVSYVLAVAQAKVANKEEKTEWDRNKAKRVEYNLKSLGTPLSGSLTEKNFTVTSDNPNYNGLILYPTASKKFYDGIRFANKTESFDLYVDSNEAEDYYLIPKNTPVDPNFLRLVVAGRAENETPEDYNNRFSFEFGIRENAVISSGRIRQSMRDRLRPPQTQEPISSKVEQSFVLPSDVLKEFETELNKFMARNNQEKNSWMIPLYDFPKLFFETGSLPEKLSDLPSKYALPGHPSYPVVKESQNPVTAVLTVDQTLGRGLEKIGEDIMEKERQRYQAEWKKVREARLNAALQKGNVDYFMSAMYKDPVATLRVQQSNKVPSYSQTSMNVLHLAFDGQQVTDQDLQQYEVSSAAFNKAQELAQAGWSPAALEYQVLLRMPQAPKQPSTFAKNVKDIATMDQTIGRSLEEMGERMLGRKPKPATPAQETKIDLNALVANISPNEFPLDSEIKNQILRDVREFMSETNTFSGVAYQRIANILDDPTAGIKLKQEYLLAMLSPGVRTLEGSRDSVRIRGIAQRMIRGFE